MLSRIAISGSAPWKRLPVAVAIALAAAGCSKSTESPQSPAPIASLEVVEQSETARLKQFFAESFELELEREPLSASYIGRETHKDQWNSVSEAFREESATLRTQNLAQVAQFDDLQLDEAARLSKDLFVRNLNRERMLDEFRHERYAIHQFRGPHTQVPSVLINVHRVKNIEDAEAYIGRINNVSTYFDEVIEQLNIRAQEGLMLVDWMYPKMLEAAGNVITGVPFDDSDKDSVIWSDFKGKVAALDIEAAQKDALLGAARKGLVESLKPAYQRLMETLEAQSAAASSEDGVWRFERGADYYQALLNWFTTTELSADEVHSLGLANVERIHNDMRVVMGQVGFDGTLQEFFTTVRENQDLRFPNTDDGRDAYLAAAEAAIDAMRGKLPEYFGILPKAELTVKRVEEFRERSAGKAFYQSPPQDGSRPGIYYANLYDMSAMPKTDIEALAFHEGVPGHHLQRAITTELDGIPDFQRYISFTAFTEGWGLYSEYLAKEMGFYQDPYSEFGRLAMELWRAARLVVDTGIHAKRWTREEAIQYLVDNTPNAQWDCTKAIERYIAMPGQATAYMIGKIRILELREMAKAELGDDFDIREFHDTVLKNGPVPLDVLADNVNAMIAAKKGMAAL